MLSASQNQTFDVQNSPGSSMLLDVEVICVYSHMDMNTCALKKTLKRTLS